MTRCASAGVQPIDCVSIPTTRLHTCNSQQSNRRMQREQSTSKHSMSAMHWNVSHIMCMCLLHLAFVPPKPHTQILLAILDANPYLSDGSRQVGWLVGGQLMRPVCAEQLVSR